MDKDYLEIWKECLRSPDRLPRLASPLTGLRACLLIPPPLSPREEGCNGDD